MSPSLRACVALLLCLLASFAAAANVRPNGATVVVNEARVFAFKAPDGETRARNLVQSLSALVGGEPVEVAKVQGHLVIRVGRVEIDGLATEAALRSVAERRLATEWAERLRYALNLPPLRLDMADVQIGVGAHRSVALVGSAVPRALAHVDDPTIANVALTPDGLSVLALKPGRARVTITAGTATELLDVTVKPWAAVLPQSLSVEVSGSPALASTVGGAIKDALQTKLSKAAGATETFAMPSVAGLPSGASATYTVRTRVTAPDSLSALGEVQVTVRNVALPPAKDELLWYCNNPESVQRPGPLFSATLKLNARARLLYHHTNASEQAMFLRVQAINDADAPARVFIVPGDSAPDRDPVHAGLKAADQYLRAALFESGEVVTIPPHQTLPISLRRLLPGEAMSGLCTLRLLSGPPAIQVRTDAWPLFPIDKSWENALWSSTPWREVGPSPVNDYDTAPYEPSVQIFRDPSRQDNLSYRVGDRFAVWRIGQRPIASLDDQQKLDGNFGVLYTLKGTLENPTASATDVELVFEASAGYAGGLFVLDGDVIDTPPMRPKAQVRIGVFHLEPGAHRTFSLTTLPLSGSSYPASLTLRPVQSSAQAPVSGRS